MNQKADSDSTPCRGKAIGQPHWQITRIYSPDCLTLLLLVAFLLSACAAQDNQATPSPTFDIAPTAVTLVTATTTPSPTAHLQLTPTVSPTPTTIPKFTSAATRRPTSTPRPTLTPRPPDITSFPTVTWSNGVEIVQDVATNNIAWSPTANEFIFANCVDSDYNLIPDGGIIKMTASNFAPFNLTQPNRICSGYNTFSWSPNGQRIAFGSRMEDEEGEYYYDWAELWIMDRDGQNIHPVAPSEATAKWLNIPGWMDNQTVVYTGWSGGGYVYTDARNIFSGASVAWGSVSGQFFEPTADYIPAYDGMGYWSNVSAAVVSKEAIERDLGLEGGPFIRWLGWTFLENGMVERAFYSHFVDWLPATNEMLVLTWPPKASVNGMPFVENASAIQLELWNVDTDELTPLVLGGIHGHFAPDGRTLAFITAGPPTLDSEGRSVAPPQENLETFYINLLDMTTGQVILSFPAMTIADAYDLPNGYDTFSPDGRYFTFFTTGPIQPGADGRPVAVQPNPDPEGTAIWLNIVDVRTGQLLRSTIAHAMTPVGQALAPAWSPTNERLVYRDESGSFAILFLDGQPTFQLVYSGGPRLSQPQWSFDGQYLSVGYYNEGCGCRTAVIHLP